MMLNGNQADFANLPMAANPVDVTESGPNPSFRIQKSAPVPRSSEAVRNQDNSRSVLLRVTELVTADQIAVAVAAT